MVTRRLFLGAGCGSLLPLVLPVTATAVVPSHEFPQHSRLNEKSGAICDVMEDGKCVARLILVNIEQPFIDETKLSQFSINFEAPDPVNLSESSYQVIHPTAGQFDLFLQPCGHFVGDQHNGIHFRACLSVLR